MSQEIAVERPLRIGPLGPSVLDLGDELATAVQDLVHIADEHDAEILIQPRVRFTRDTSPDLTVHATPTPDAPPRVTADENEDQTLSVWTILELPDPEHAQENHDEA